MTSIGIRLKKIRKALFLSQEQFAKEIGLSRGSIASVEADCNKFSQEVLCKLILTFNININYLLVGQGNMFIENEYKNINLREEIINTVVETVDKMLKERGL